jgi:tetratricopeptide (TPR) repeat protein
MRLFTTGLIFVVVVATATLAQEAKSPFDELSYEELQWRLEGAITTGNWATAQEIARAMIKQREDDPASHYWRAYALLRTDKIDKLEDVLKMNLPLSLTLSAISNKINKLEDALQEFDKVKSLDPDNLQAYIGRAIACSLKAQQSFAKMEFVKQHSLWKKELQDVKEEDLLKQESSAKEEYPKQLGLAKEELSKAARKGFPVREMLGIPELKECLTDPKFFIKLVKEEIVEVSPVKDPLVCPLRLPAPPTPTTTTTKQVSSPPEGSPEYLTPEQQGEREKEMKRLCKEIGDDIAAGKNEDACEKFRTVKALYKDVLDGRIVDEIRTKMEGHWTQVRQEHLRQIIEIEFAIFEREAIKLLKDLSGACGERKLSDAEKYSAQLMSKLKEKLESTEPEFEPFKKPQKEYAAKKEERSKKYDAERKEIDKRWAVLKEYVDEISPRIRLSATIIGQGVQSIAYLETRFDGKPVTHIMYENGKLLLPNGAELTLTKIEDDKIAADYEIDVIKLKDGTTTKGKIITESKEDITVRIKPDALVTIKRNEIEPKRNEIEPILKYKEPVEKVMSRSFSASSGSASGAGPKAP